MRVSGKALLGLMLEHWRAPQPDFPEARLGRAFKRKLGGKRVLCKDVEARVY